MDLIRGLHNLNVDKRGCVATIGNFDGVHVGHQHILQNLRIKGAEMGLPTVLITFDPQPQEFFRQDKVPPRLTRLREKLLIIMRHGTVDKVVCLHFNTELANMEAEQFIKEILIQKLGIQYLVVGDDFRFGKNRQGNFQLLQQAGKNYGFEVVRTPTIEVDNKRVSSSWIRELLAQGDLAMAKRLLGRSYGMNGRVAHGDKRGRMIGFPTANIYLHRPASPILGVYAVKMYGVKEHPLNGVANVGNRPTVDGKKTLLEVHLFDFNQDIYGYHVRVDFISRLRDEKRFESFDILKQQILLDAAQAREYFANLKDLG